MGIVVGSLLVPLYFLTVAALVNAEVALAASVILLWMTNYVYQSISLTTILPGILFIVSALLAAVRYHKKGGEGYLYLSGCLINMSVFCRYENVFLLPAFVGYEYLFDKKAGFFSRIVYGLLCAGSSLYILYCNGHLYGDPFYVVRQQTAAAFQCPGYNGPIPLTAVFGVVWGLLLRLLSPWLWGAAVVGMILMIKRHRFRAAVLFLGAFLLPLFLMYKTKSNTLGFDENYFFLLALIALPLGLEFVRAFFVGLGRRRIYGVLALGVAAVCSVASFHRANILPLDIRWYYCPGLIRFTEALKGIRAASVLYIDYALNRPGFYVQDVLVYLRRDPVKFSYDVGFNEPREQEYYLLTKDSLIGKVPKKKAVKVRDYGVYGYDGFGLYLITRS